MTAASTVDARPETAADLVDTGNSAFCHVVCNIHPDKTMCGLTGQRDIWCTDDPCNNTCVVCADLEDGWPPCPVCGTDCASTEERS